MVNLLKENEQFQVGMTIVEIRTNVSWHLNILILATFNEFFESRRFF